MYILLNLEHICLSFIANLLHYVSRDTRCYTHTQTHWILHDSADGNKALTFSCHKQIQHYNIVIINEHTHQVTYSKAFKTYQTPKCPESYNVGTLTYIENDVRISHVEFAVLFCCNCHRFKFLKQQQIDHKDTVFTGM